jgi:protein TonB
MANSIAHVDDSSIRRLIAAALLSAALHAALLFWLPFQPAAGRPGPVGSLIEARIQPAQLATPTEEDDASPSANAAEFAASAEEQAQLEPAPKSKPVPPTEMPAAVEPLPPQTAAIEAPLIRDPTYYSAKQLDAYPDPLSPIRLQYPETAVADQVNGRVLLLILIDEFGVVSEVSAVEADPPGYFEEAAGAVFKGTRFKPGMKQGRAVKCRVLVQVRYTYGDAEGAVK